MTSFTRGPRLPVPVFLLSAAAEMDIAVKEGRAMDVNTISKHDARVRNHPWYPQRAPSSNSGKCDVTTPLPRTNHSRSLPPRLERTRIQERRVDRDTDVSTATLPMMDITDWDL